MSDYSEDDEEVSLGSDFVVLEHIMEASLPDKASPFPSLQGDSTPLLARSLFSVSKSSEGLHIFLADCKRACLYETTFSPDEPDSPWEWKTYELAIPGNACQNLTVLSRHIIWQSASSLHILNRADLSSSFPNAPSNTLIVSQSAEVSISPSSEYCAVIDDGKLSVYHLSGLEMMALHPLQGSYHGLKWSKCSHFVTYMGDSNCCVLRMPDNIFKVFPLGLKPSAFCWHQKKLFVLSLRETCLELSEIDPMTFETDSHTLDFDDDVKPPLGLFSLFQGSELLLVCKNEFDFAFYFVDLETHSLALVDTSFSEESSALELEFVNCSNYEVGYLSGSVVCLSKESLVVISPTFIENEFEVTKPVFSNKCISYADNTYLVSYESGLVKCEQVQNLPDIEYESPPNSEASSPNHLVSPVKSEEPASKPFSFSPPSAPFSFGTKSSENSSTVTEPEESKCFSSSEISNIFGGLNVSTDKAEKETLGKDFETPIEKVSASISDREEEDEDEELSEEWRKTNNELVKDIEHLRETSVKLNQDLRDWNKQIPLLKDGNSVVDSYNKLHAKLSSVRQMQEPIEDSLSPHLKAICASITALEQRFGTLVEQVSDALERDEPGNPQDFDKKAEQVAQQHFRYLQGLIGEAEALSARLLDASLPKRKQLIPKPAFDWKVAHQHLIKIAAEAEKKRSSVKAVIENMPKPAKAPAKIEQAPPASLGTTTPKKTVTFSNPPSTTQAPSIGVKSSFQMPESNPPQQKNLFGTSSATTASGGLFGNSDKKISFGTEASASTTSQPGTKPSSSNLFGSSNLFSKPTETAGSSANEGKESEKHSSFTEKSQAPAFGGFGANTFGQGEEKKEKTITFGGFGGDKSSESKEKGSDKAPSSSTNLFGKPSGTDFGGFGTTQTPKSEDKPTGETTSKEGSAKEKASETKDASAGMFGKSSGNFASFGGFGVKSAETPKETPEKKDEPSTSSTPAFGNVKTPTTFGSSTSTTTAAENKSTATTFGTMPSTTAFGSTTTTDSKPAAATTTVFGQQTPSTGFGSTANFGQTSTATSTPSKSEGSANLFCKPGGAGFGNSGFGMPGFGSTAFGGSTSAFGGGTQTSASSTPSKGPSFSMDSGNMPQAFSSPSNPQTQQTPSTTFGMMGNSTGTTFGTSGFGNSTSGTGGFTSGFGTSGFGGNASSATPSFGAAVPSTPGFGTTSSPAQSTPARAEMQFRSTADDL